MNPVTGSGWIPRKRVLSDAFRPDSAEKWKQYSGRKAIVPGNEEPRKVPFTGFSQEMTPIRAGI